MTSAEEIIMKKNLLLRKPHPGCARRGEGGNLEWNLDNLRNWSFEFEPRLVTWQIWSTLNGDTQEIEYELWQSSEYVRAMGFGQYIETCEMEIVMTGLVDEAYTQADGSRGTVRTLGKIHSREQVMIFMPSDHFVGTAHLGDSERTHQVGIALKDFPIGRIRRVFKPKEGVDYGL